MTHHMTHALADDDLSAAKHGRWVMLLGVKYGGYTIADGTGPEDDHVAPVAIAKWMPGTETAQGYWISTWAAGQQEGFWISGAEAFVELSDLGLFMPASEETV